MDGKTAYEVSKKGYSKHLSQQWTWFTDWINGKNNKYTKATEIKTYSPLKYGLYYTNVGEDIQKNDMFENITYYKTEFEEAEKLKEDEDKNIIEEQTEWKEQNNIKIQKDSKQYLLILIITGILIILGIIIKNRKKC